MLSSKLALLLSGAACHASMFQTEPTFRAEVFNTSHVTEDSSLLAPGYIFLEPLLTKNAFGPQIYSQDGNLVFSGGHRRVQDFKRCDYLGEQGTHLCWHQSRFQPGTDPRIQKRDEETHILEKREAPRPVGKKLVFDNTYRQVGQQFTDGITDGEDKNWPNGHEYNMLPGGETFIQAVYRPKPWDLREFSGEENGYILDGCFQEINVRNGDILFTWCYSDNVPLSESNLHFLTDGKADKDSSKKGGTGVEEDPWDFVHINAIDKTPEGDYLVSGRHFDQILKIAGPKNIHGLKPGDIMWRCGGQTNDFEMEDGLLFTKQHHVRHMSTTATETIVSFYNNAWEGTNEPSAERSAGMIVSINNSTMKAKLLREYPHPDGLLGRAMGSMQTLPNENVLMGWGASPQITEFAKDGTVLWHTWYNFADWETQLKNVEEPKHEWTYRAFKFPWVGKPYWDPKLLPYAQSCNVKDGTPLYAYASWNGATEFTRWRFSVSKYNTGPWKPAGTYDRDGFETKVKLSGKGPNKTPGFIPWVMAEALGPDGEVMGRTIAQTFVPKSTIADHCNNNGCFRALRDTFKYARKDSCSWTCMTVTILDIGVLILALLVIEALSFFGGKVSLTMVDLEVDGDFGDPQYGALGMGRKDKRLQANGRRNSLERRVSLDDLTGVEK